MQHEWKQKLDTIPVGALGVIPLEGCRELVTKVDKYLVEWRTERESEHKDSLAFEGYQRDSYLIQASICRFGTGEAKGVINESIRGMDLFLLCDVCNYSMSYKLCGRENHMSPDDHYQDLKRIIAAVGGKARRITVIMPYLYEGRQQKRSARESLDCAIALQELVRMGVDNIITFDAHDARVQNAIPLNGFDTIQPAYQFIKGLLTHVRGLKMDASHMMVMSPDEAGTKRAIALASIMGLEMGIFYRRKDYSAANKDRDSNVSPTYLGPPVNGKDVLIIDDMIESGDSVIKVASLLRERGAGRVFVMATFGIFSKGLEEFDKAYEEGLIFRMLTTNCIYQPPELLEREYYISCDMSKFIALIIDTLNHDASISDLLVPDDRILRLIKRYQAGEVEIVE